ncbi:MAG: rod shape-determining protein MreD [Acidobacteria bacterium]|nr:rod shape-determining protein MreD [Acidobacteriota bacterium]
MEKDSYGTTLKTIICLVAAIFVQTTLAQLLPRTIGTGLGYVDWLLLVTVYVSLQREPVRAMITGVFAGLLHDFFSGMNAMGVSGLGYLVSAYVTYSIVSIIVVDNLLVRVLVVAASSVANTSIRLLFYRLLGIDLPVLAGGGSIASTIVFSLIANLGASILLYLILDRLFSKNAGLRLRRSEARRGDSRRRRLW